MLLYQHFLLSLIPAGVIFYFNRFGALIFLATVILLDADHYPVYVLKFKKLSPIKAYKYFVGITEKCDDPAILHSPELMILILICAYFYNWLFFIALGMFVHLMEDVYDSKQRKIKRYFSLIHWIKEEGIYRMKNRKLFI